MTKSILNDSNSLVADLRTQQMGFHGDLHIYTMSSLPEPVETLQRLIDLLDISDIRMWGGQEYPPGCILTDAMRWDGPDRSWRNLQLLESGITPPEETELEFIKGPIDRAALGEIYPPNGRLYIGLGQSALAMPLCEAVNNLPEEITNRFCPAAWPAIKIGWHDIIDEDFHANAFLVDRAFLSVSVGNPGSPNDPRKAREMILSLPELKTFRETLETVVGPMKTWVMWT